MCAQQQADSISIEEVSGGAVVEWLVGVVEFGVIVLLLSRSNDEF